MKKAKLSIESQRDDGNVLSSIRLRLSGTFNFTGICTFCYDVIADLNKNS